MRLVNSPIDDPPGASTANTYNYTNLMPNTSFTFKALSYTNMRATFSDTDNWQVCDGVNEAILTTNSVTSNKVTKLDSLTRCI